MDRTSEALVYVEIVRERESNLHLFVADGGEHPMGFVMDDNGEPSAGVWNGTVYHGDEPDAFGEAIQLLWKHGTEGNSVEGLRDVYLENKNSGHLFHVEPPTEEAVAAKRRELHRLKRHSSQKLISEEDFLSLPKRIHQPILESFKRFVAEDDYGEWMAADVRQTDDEPSFTYDTMKYPDLAHGALPGMYANEAFEFRYQKITGPQTLHVFVAFGSPSSGAIFDTKGHKRFEIGDFGVYAAQGEPEDPAEILAVNALVFWAEDGQAIVELREEIALSKSDAFDALFGAD